MRELTDKQLKCIQAFLSGRMELNHGERIKVYRDFFDDPSISSTKDLSINQANTFISSIKNDPDGLENKVANILGWKRLIEW